MGIRHRCTVSQGIHDTQVLVLYPLKKAWEATEKSNLPKFHLNLKSYRKSLLNNSTYTPAVNLVFALDEALKMMRDEVYKTFFTDTININ